MRSLRSRWIIASVLWTAGLLMVMHLASIHLMRVFPRMGRSHGTWMVLAGGALMAAGFAAMRGGFAALRPLRTRLQALRDGSASSVEGEYPAEVQPLIDDLNGLLQAREQAVQRARTAAADLAHGLKTPLALLASEAARAQDPELAATIAQQVERMSRQVDYQLARARASASGTTGVPACALAPCVEALARTLAKIHAAKALAMSCDVPAEAAVRVRREDLDEILGNVFDNACKWAKSTVAVRVERSGAMQIVTVDDDGPGLPPESRELALRRGVRLDELAPGSGLGLAIVRDLVELHGGAVSLQEAPAGGLRVRLSLPAG